ncbi:MAG: DUF6259 domain-containing protein [Terracidiphilus sp.]
MAMIPEMTRRTFIRNSALGGASLLASGEVLAAAGSQGEQAIRPAKGGTVSGARDEKSIVENERMRIELDPNSGDIVGLCNKRSGREYIAAREWAKAFRLNVPLPGRVTGFNADYSANAFDSWMQKSCTIAQERSEEGQTVWVRYSKVESAAGTFPIGVAYSIHLPNDSDEATLRLEIENRSPYQVKEVFFPWISGVQEVEDVASDTFAAPNMIHLGTELRRHFDADANWEEYPYLLDIPTWPDGYSLSMPWMNYGGKSEGIYLASNARTGIHHMLMVQDYGRVKHPVLAFAWAFPSYIAPGKTWRSPELVLSLHDGDWHAAADKYRSSLSGWYRKPDTQPDFKRSFASFNSFFTELDFMQIAELAEDILKYDLRHLVMWNFGDYYPEVMQPDDLSVDPPRLGEFTPQWGGLPKLQAANQRARELGVSTGIIFSQRLWNKDTLTPELRKMAEDWVIRRESGDPISESWDHQHLGAAQWSGWQQSFGHLDYIMCSAVNEYRDFAIRNVRGVLKRAGYSMMFYDQVVEGNLCFSSRHDHADVSAPSMATPAFVELLKKGMKADNPDAVLIGEGWEVLSSQHLDSGWVWRVPPNPEVLRYTLPWVVNTSAVEVDAGLANRYFVLGLQLAIVAGGLENGKKLSDFPEFAGHVKRLAGFHNNTERFWVGGSFQDDIGLQVSGAFAKLYQTSREVAIMAANLNEVASAFTFDLDVSRYGIKTAEYSVISSSGSSEEGSAIRQGSVLHGSRYLAPFEVAAIVFQRAA